MRRFVIILIAAAMLVPGVAFGQAETTCRVTGRVADAEDEPIDGARVTLLSPALQGERTLRTEADGSFFAALLPVGPYVATFSSPRKQTVQVSFRLSVGQTVPLQVTMQPGTDIVEKVTVLGAATPLETTIVGENFDYEKTVEELPIVARNVLEVATYAPNVHDGPWAPDVLVGRNRGLAISGAAPYDSVVQLDGADISDPYFGLGLLLYIEDAVEEVQVMTSGISARYGKFQGGVINTITKNGSNDLHGTLRAEFAQEDWNSRTPFGEELSDDLNQAYQGTLGGSIQKDRLWYFAGVRWVPTKTTSGATQGTGENFDGRSHDTRWQLKLRGAPAVNHTLEAGYLKRSFDSTAPGSFYGDLLAAQASYVNEPMSLLSLGYQSVIGGRGSLEARLTSKRHKTECCGNGAPRSSFFDGGRGISWNAEVGDPDHPWHRDQDSAGVSYVRSLGSERAGRHTLEVGLQVARSTASGITNNGATGYALDGFPFGETPFAEVDPSTGAPLYNIGGDVAAIRWKDVGRPTPKGSVDSLALYAQDAWRLGNWRFDLGLRWERYDESIFDVVTDEFAPRLGVTREFSTRWQLQATAGRYVAKFHDQLLTYTAGVRGWPGIGLLYEGVPRAGLTADELEAVIRDNDEWGAVFGVYDSGQPHQFLSDDIALPYTDEFTLGVRGALPRDSGSFTATVIDRDFENLLDNVVGESGAQILVDPDTGNLLPDPIDNVLWDNAPLADRRYRALAVTWDYRPGAVWSLGGNWTWSRLTGNREEVGILVGSPIGTYERSRPEVAAVPDGYLSEDGRHVLQIWGDYRFDLKRAGTLVLGAIGRSRRGGRWSRTAPVYFADDPVYNNEAFATYDHFFEGRGKNRFDDWWSLDLSARWQTRIHKKLDVWLKATAVNVLDNDSLISYDIGGRAVDDGTGNPAWEPRGDCGPGDAPSVDCTGFGRIRSQADFQTPRSYLFTVGLSF